MIAGSEGTQKAIFKRNHNSPVHQAYQVARLVLAFAPSQPSKQTQRASVASTTPLLAVPKNASLGNCQSPTFQIGTRTTDLSIEIKALQHELHLQFDVPMYAQRAHIGLLLLRARSRLMPVHA